MKKIVPSVVAGVVLAGVVGWNVMPKQMIQERRSPLGYAETIAKIEQNVKDGGWIISSTMHLDESLKKQGKEAPPVTLINICQPDHAAAILSDESARYISIMMPCTISVYQKSDGNTYVATMGMRLMGKMFGGVIADVMGGKVAEEEETFTDFLD
ncbi:MAG: DUF302 domain-containing protein [Pontiellaceae bacterium]|nr:DUF302 domain-containing protein [Pontiellaceae bacterium]MBN2783325.1 DUF302 domain-containing protein [Pontiellaceae bacterium]